jgi:hypothetical protein
MKEQESGGQSAEKVSKRLRLPDESSIMRSDLQGLSLRVFKPALSFLQIRISAAYTRLVFGHIHNQHEVG